MKVLFTTNIPSPYRVDFFNELGKYCDLTVIFERQKDKSRNAKWAADRIDTFEAVFLHGVRTGEAEALCPGILNYLSLKKFDVIVIGAYHTLTGMLAIDYMRMKKIPFLLSSDGGLVKKDSWIKYKVKWHYISAASMWLSTGKITSRYLEHYGASKDYIRIYPFTSIHEKEIRKTSVEQKKLYRHKLNIPYENVLLSIGQFIPRKGYDILLRACKNLDESVGIYLVGGRPTKEYLNICKDLNLRNVHFIDFMNKEQLKEYYRAADIFVLPTREDIWGLVINEAMSFGLPVIVSDRCVAGCEMICDGKNGELIPLEEKNIYNSIVRLLGDAELREEYAVQSLQTAKSYTIEQMGQVHIKIFEEYMSRR